jgi:hypothetical protein
MGNTITARTAKPGDFVYLRTATPVAAGRQIVVLRQGSTLDVIFDRGLKLD